MTFLEMVPYLSALALVTSVATIWWNIFQSPAKKNAGDIEGLQTLLTNKTETLHGAIALLRKEVAAECKLIDDKADAVGGRVGTLETLMQQMPDKDSQHRLEMGLSDLRGDFKEMRADLRPVAAIAERMQELLVRQAAPPAPSARARV